MDEPPVRPGRKPRISQGLIVDSALEILASEGADGLSLRRLAADLGVTPRALYRHFSSKDDLETAIVGRVMPDLSTTLDGGRDWHEQLRTSVLEIHDAIVVHPGSARLFLAGSTGNAATNRLREHLLMLLVASGLPEDDVVAAVGTLSRYLLGCVAIEDERRRHPEAADAPPGVLDRGEFPYLAAMAGRYADRNRSESMRYGLDLIVAGLRERADAARPITP